MSMSEVTPWRDLIALLTNNATAIAAVVLCAENPNEYFEQHRDALGMRLIDTPRRSDADDCSYRCAHHHR
jgi:hypothetical protein